MALRCPSYAVSASRVLVICIPHYRYKWSSLHLLYSMLVHNPAMYHFNVPLLDNINQNSSAYTPSPRPNNVAPRKSFVPFRRK